MEFYGLSISLFTLELAIIDPYLQTYFFFPYRQQY